MSDGNVENLNINLEDITIIRTYKIHDNGGRPYVVHYCVPKDATKMEDKKFRNIVVVQYNQEDYLGVDDNFIEELKTEKYYWDGPTRYNASLPIKPIIFLGGLDRVWVDNNNKETLRIHKEDGVGNTILLERGDDYIWVGNCGIKRYNIVSNIVMFVSDIGNSDVPYPYAVDDDGVYYLFLEDVKLSNVPEEYKTDPYSYYYKHRSKNGDNIDGITKLESIIINERLY